MSKTSSTQTCLSFIGFLVYTPVIMALIPALALRGLQQVHIQPHLAFILPLYILGFFLAVGSFNWLHRLIWKRPFTEPRPRFNSWRNDLALVLGFTVFSLIAFIPDTIGSAKIWWLWGITILVAIPAAVGVIYLVADAGLRSDMRNIRIKKRQQGD